MLDTFQRETKENKEWKILFGKGSCVSIIKNWLRVTRSIRKTDATMLHSDCPSLVVQLRVENVLADITSNLDEPREVHVPVCRRKRETSASFLSIVIENNRIINVQFEPLLDHRLLLQSCYMPVYIYFSFQTYVGKFTSHIPQFFWDNRLEILDLRNAFEDIRNVIKSSEY